VGWQVTASKIFTSKSPPAKYPLLEEQPECSWKYYCQHFIFCCSCQKKKIRSPWRHSLPKSFITNSAAITVCLSRQDQILRNRS